MTSNLPQISTDFDLRNLFGDARGERAIPFGRMTEFSNGNLLLPDMDETFFSNKIMTVDLYDPHLELRTCVQASKPASNPTVEFYIAQFKGSNPDFGTTNCFSDQWLQSMDFKLDQNGAPTSIRVESKPRNITYLAEWLDNISNPATKFTRFPDRAMFDEVKNFYRAAFENVMNGQMPDFADIQSIVEFPLTKLESIGKPASSKPHPPTLADACPTRTP